MRPAIDPDDPWLFERQGLDWRWLSWREAAARIDELAAALAGRAPASEVRFDGRPSVASVLTDCAVLAAGLTAVPSEAGDGTDLTREPPLDAASLAAPRLHPTASLEGARALPAVVDLGALPPTAGVVVDGPGAPSRLAAADLARAAQRLAQQMGQATERDITVLGACLDRPLARWALAWALASGAALVVEPEVPAFENIAAWARPTVLAATAAELARWAELAGQDRGGPRSPLGRLRAFLVPAAEPLPPPAIAYWQGRGVALVPVELAIHAR